MAEPPKRPSLRTGDPFAEVGGLATNDDDPELERWRLRRQLRWRTGWAALALTAGLGAATVLWLNRSHLAYALGEAGPPLALGSVTGVAPAQIPHNSFVALEGITEHRGLVKKRARGVGVRQELWYFRLLGGRGVFLETPADKERFGVVTEVHVSGRAVDPLVEGGYDDVLETYRERFLPEQRAALRIIQVDVRPGEGSGPYLLVGGWLLTCLALAAVLLRRVRATYGRYRALGEG